MPTPEDDAPARAADESAAHPRGETIAETREFPVHYDPPAETKRMALIFITCIVFSIAGMVLASRASHEVGRTRTRDKLVAAAIALSGGLFTIGLVRARYRPGGGHARGIVVDLTHDELRLWGRGYGTRIAYREARVRHRMVDAYLGRLGGMRQLRVVVEGGGKTIEVATEAMVEDRARQLAVEGGEGDCVVLDREVFEAFEEDLLARVAKR